MLQICKYFELPSAPIDTLFLPAPIVKIDTNSNHKVDDDLEQLFSDNVYSGIQNLNYPSVYDDQYTWTLRLIYLFEGMDITEWEASGKPIEEYNFGPKPTVVVFLPGINEIMSMYKLEEWKSW